MSFVGGRSADQLRALFDRSFAELPRAESASREPFLAIRVGGEPYAVRLGDVAGLVAHKSVTVLPGPSAHLLGLAAFRSRLVPVYDLPGLLGYRDRYQLPGPGCQLEAGWLALLREPNVALTFDGLEGYLLIGPEFRQARGHRAHSDGILIVRDNAGSMCTRTVLDLSSLVQALGKDCGPPGG